MYLLYTYLNFLDDCLQGKVHSRKSASTFKQKVFRKNLNEMQIFHNYSKFLVYLL